MKKIPKFKTEAEEREFWATADSRDYVDWSTAGRVRLPNLKPSLKTISLRLPEMMIEELKLLANKKDVPYQSLIKIFLSERLASELGTEATVAGQAKPAGYSRKR
jgi:predicted DNA binding CopG/RHH family protein